MMGMLLLAQLDKVNYDQVPWHTGQHSPGTVVGFSQGVRHCLIEVVTTAACNNTTTLSLG